VFFVSATLDKLATFITIMIKPHLFCRTEQTVQAIKAQRAGVDVDDAGAVMGASPPQLKHGNPVKGERGH